MFQHYAGRVINDDLADHLRRHHDLKRQRIILQDPRNIHADRLHSLAEIRNNLVIAAQIRLRRDHHTRRAKIHGTARKRSHGRKTRGGDTHYNRSFSGAVNHLLDKSERFAHLELRRFAHNPEDRQPRYSTSEIEINHPVD